MPKALAAIPSGTQITNPDGTITIFFRLQYQQIVNSFLQTPDVAVVANATPQTAAVPTTTAFLPLTAGWYRVSAYLRKTVPDGVSSSIALTVGWTDHGQPLTNPFGALTLDTAAAFYCPPPLLFYSDAVAPITYAISYASNTPGAMAFSYGIVVEQMA